MVRILVTMGARGDSRTGVAANVESFVTVVLGVASDVYRTSRAILFSSLGGYVYVQ